MDVFREIFLMQQTYATLFSLANKLQVQGDKYFHGLTSRQFMTIIAIAHLPEDETTIINIARKLGTTKQSVKQLINAMEEKGYITIVPSQKDKRAVNVQITGSGKKIAMECSEKGLKLFTDLFKNFTTDEMETLWGLLKKLYSFDGEEQDGFEENVQLEMDDDLIAAQEKVLEEFVQRRSEKK